MPNSAFEIPTRDLKGIKIPLDVLRYIPKDSAEFFQILPLAIADGVLEVGMVDPDDAEARDAVQFVASKNSLPYKVFLLSLDSFKEGVKSYEGLGGTANDTLGDLNKNIAAAEKTVESFTQASAPTAKKAGIVEEAPVTKIVSVILQHATSGGASDIHIEPTANNVQVRFRVDGILHSSLNLPRTVHEAIIARIKILTNMKLDEKRKPQDGRFSATIEGRKVDFRVSTFPTYFGEKVVLRILDPEKKLLSLEVLGLSPEQIAKIREAVSRPYGLILLTGPTGSGKSTTLYSMLSEVDRDKYNVVSLEDPIEYDIPGVSQSQVQPEINYTFANGLRSILRQDPDIIMVGEIRDRETAKLAIQASLTGHLVFSTLHTNNAAGVVPRLIDMGVDPYLIPPTLIMAIGQRLVPMLCEEAKKAAPVEESIRVMLDKEFADLPEQFKATIPTVAQVFHSQTSPSCPSGTRGRIGVFELLPMDADLEKMILTNPVESKIFQTARAKGFLTLKEDAIMKAAKGLISFEEVNKL